MGGDIGPAVTMIALRKFMVEHSRLRVILFGAEPTTAFPDDQESAQLASRVQFVNCSSVVESGERPSSALRHKGGSSMALAVQAVADGDASACVSAGNTGALMAFGLQKLKTLPGISRPAICSPIPTRSGDVLALDLGANIDCSAAQLHQFALLGALTARIVNGIANPKLKLRNIGLEANKGMKSVQEAATLLAEDVRINYCGFIEADRLFHGDADVVVCDGLSGNIALKASEGVASMISDIFRDHINSHWLSRLAFRVFMRSTASLSQRLHPSRYNGAYLLGLNGIIIKSHGGADSQSFYEALNLARLAAGENLPSVLAPLLASDLSASVHQTRCGDE